MHPLFRADLHTHSTCSDGSFTPVELVDLAHQMGFQGLSITDHDSIDAYETAISRAKELGILLGTGVEFSCQFQDVNVHILGYNYQLSHPAIHAFCRRHRERREKRNRAILEKLARHGMLIDETELKGNTIGRPHIAQLMVQKGYIRSIKDAFTHYLGDNKLCCAPSASFSVAETIDLIHQIGGKAFLAHPHLMLRGHLIKELLKLPFDGIECYYSRCHWDQEKRWIKMAQEKGLLISGGSDFHGSIKPDIFFGCSWVDESTFFRIFS